MDKDYLTWAHANAIDASSALFFAATLSGCQPKVRKLDGLSIVSAKDVLGLEVSSMDAGLVTMRVTMRNGICKLCMVGEDTRIKAGGLRGSPSVREGLRKSSEHVLQPQRT